MSTENSQAINNADAILSIWAERPEVTKKAFTVQHGVKEGQTFTYPESYDVTVKEKGEEKVLNLGGTKPATGETAYLFQGAVDLAPAWDAPVEIIRGYAIGAILLNAQQLFKSRVLAGTASIGSQEDMDKAFTDMLSTPATMQGITPSASKAGNGEKKAGNGKVKKAERIMELNAQMRELRAQIKATKGADKLTLLEQHDALDAELETLS